jgi:predicted alpha/beta hydrolase family esterase
VVLVAHSLGCILTAWWAAHTRHAARVRAALLVAPGDVERPDIAAQIHGWAPIARQPLPFPALLVGSQNDAYCSLERAQDLAQAWDARFVDLGERGHINAESNLGDWPEGHALLETLFQD